MKDAVETAALFAGLLVSLCILAGFAARFVLWPWIRDHIVTKLDETHSQVTVNKHVSKTPTLLDRVDTTTAHVAGLVSQLDTVESKVDDTADRVNATARMLDGHLDRSSGEWGRLWDSIYDVREHVGLPRKPPTERPDPRHD